MRKSYLMIISVGIMLILSFGILQAQPIFDLQLVVERNDAMNGGFFDVKIQMKANNGTFELGSSNLVFDYNNGGLTNPMLLTGHNFNGGNYNTMTVTEPVSGRASTNIELFVTNNGQTVTSTFMDVATIRFEITTFTQTSGMFWRMSAPNATTVFMDDEAAQVEEGTLVGLDVSLPVELASFTVNVGEGSVVLNWTTASETNNLGFDVERSPDGTEFQKVGFVEGNGTTTTPQQYEFEDDLSEPGTYSYRLKQIDLDGTFEYSSVIEATITGPQDFTLAQNYPNPFNPETNIRYEVPVASKVTLVIYNILGEKIRTLVDEEKPIGQHSVLWDSRDDYGRNVGSGVYFYRMTADNFSKTMKLTLIK